MTCLPLSMLFGDLEMTIKPGPSLEFFKNTSFFTLKHFIVDGITLMKMVSAIGVLEEKFGIDTTKYFKIPEQYHSLMLNPLMQHHITEETKSMGKYDFLEKVEENFKSLRDIKIHLEDVLHLEKFADDETLQRWISQNPWGRAPIQNFLDYLRCVAIVSQNIIGYKTSLHIFMAMFLIPLFEFLKKQDRRLYFRVRSNKKETPLPNNHIKIYPEMLIPQKCWTIDPQSIISVETQVIFLALCNPHYYVDKNKYFEFMIDKQKALTFSQIELFIEKFFLSERVESPICKVNIQDFTAVKEYLNSEHLGLIGKIAKYRWEEMDSKMKYLNEFFKNAFVTIIKWETALDILKQMFSRKAADNVSNALFSYHLRNDSSQPSTSTSVSPDHNVWNSSPITSFPVEPTLYLLPFDLKAPTFELVPIGPAPAGYENDPAWNENQCPLDDTIIYQDNDYYIATFGQLFAG